MNQSVKTLLFVAAAAVSVAVAAGTYYSSKPVDIADFSDVGDMFYPKFTDPQEATGLRVAAYNEATGKTEVFKVENRDGLWQIPSHHNYPADGKEMLSKTAASMIGVIREALVERTKAAHKRYKVLDPLDDDLAGTEGRGDRITLYQGNDVLVDFIVGNKAPNSDSIYYVRRADEDRIYTADLGNFRVSTKFSDWIEKDILEVNPDDVRELIINRDYVDEVQGRLIRGGTDALSRKSDTDPWTLEGLDAQKEKVNESNVGALVRSLRDLKIVGVRKKPAALIAGLKSQGEGFALNQFDQLDLQRKGIFLAGGRFVYNEGKVNVGTSDGVLYELGFGEEFIGSEVDIEVGGEPSPAEEAKELEKEEAAADPAQSAEGEKKDEEKKEEKDEKKEENSDSLKPGQKKSRYLFVMAYFDKSLLGPEPTPPVAPEKPADVEKAEAEKSKNTSQDEAEKKDAKEEKQEAAEQAPSEEAKDAEKPTEEKAADAEKPDPQKEYEKALKEYELQKEAYEAQKKKYDEDLAAGQKRVAELNARFADWYYVISEDAFERLKLKREDLVQEVTPEKSDETDENKEKPADDAATPSSDTTPETATPSDAPSAESAPAMKDQAESKGEPAPAEKEEKKADGAGEAKAPTPDQPAKEPSGEKPADAEKPEGGDKPAEKPAEPAADAPKPESEPAPQ